MFCIFCIFCIFVYFVYFVYFIEKSVKYIFRYVVVGYYDQITNNLTWNTDSEGQFNDMYL